MAEVVAAVLESRFDEAVLLVGIGFGGNVGAELALTYPEVVSGVVMVDTDLWSRRSSYQTALQRLPWVGKAATYTWMTGGRFAIDEWSPHCEAGGWCPTQDELGRRAFIITIEDTTDSLHRFVRTNEGALAPGNLPDVTVPMSYVWSLDGPIERGTVDRLTEELPGIVVVQSSTFQAHLEDHASVGEAIAAGRRLISGDDQDLPDRVPRLEGAVGVGRLLQRVPISDEDAKLTFGHPIEEIVGPAHQLVTGPGVVRHGRSGQDRATLCGRAAAVRSPARAPRRCRMSPSSPSVGAARCPARTWRGPPRRTPRRAGADRSGSRPRP